jgi:hypothetical protein
LTNEFHGKYPATKTNVTYGSSGNFFAQLQSGAPFDLFFSADIAYPRKLAETGLGLITFSFTPSVVVVWVPKDSPLDVDRLGIKALLEPSVRKIGVANPGHDPYGRAAATLMALNVHDQVASRLAMPACSDGNLTDLFASIRGSKSPRKTRVSPIANKGPCGARDLSSVTPGRRPCVECPGQSSDESPQKGVKRCWLMPVILTSLVGTLSREFSCVSPIPAMYCHSCPN